MLFQYCTLNTRVIMKNFKPYTIYIIYLLIRTNIRYDTLYRKKLQKIYTTNMLTKTILQHAIVVNS